MGFIRSRHSSFVSCSEGVRISRSPGFPTSHNLDHWSPGFRHSSFHHRIQTLRELPGVPSFSSLRVHTRLLSLRGFPSPVRWGSQGDNMVTSPGVFYTQFSYAVIWRTRAIMPKTTARGHGQYQAIVSRCSNNRTLLFFLNHCGILKIDRMQIDRRVACSSECITHCFPYIRKQYLWTRR